MAQVDHKLQQAFFESHQVSRYAETYDGSNLQSIMWSQNRYDSPDKINYKCDSNWINVLKLNVGQWKSPYSTKNKTCFGVLVWRPLLNCKAFVTIFLQLLIHECPQSPSAADWMPLKHLWSSRLKTTTTVPLANRTFQEKQSRQSRPKEMKYVDGSSYSHPYSALILTQLYMLELQHAHAWQPSVQLTLNEICIQGTETIQPALMSVAPRAK